MSGHGTRAGSPTRSTAREQARDDGDLADCIHRAFPPIEQALVPGERGVRTFEKERVGREGVAVDAAEVGEGEGERSDLEMDAVD